MRVKGTLYVSDHRARVRLRRGTLVVEQPGGWQRVPIEALDGVILTGRAEISNDAIGELARRGIRVAALSRTGKLRFAIGGPVRDSQTHARTAVDTYPEPPVILDN
jgi:CRISPR/Cas system-associated endonuclease Cas1